MLMHYVLVLKYDLVIAHLACLLHNALLQALQQGWRSMCIRIQVSRNAHEICVLDGIRCAVIVLAIASVFYVTVARHGRAARL
jgi:hypothetical protein